MSNVWALSSINAVGHEKAQEDFESRKKKLNWSSYQTERWNRILLTLDNGTQIPMICFEFLKLNGPSSRTMNDYTKNLTFMRLIAWDSRNQSVQIILFSPNSIYFLDTHIKNKCIKNLIIVWCSTFRWRFEIGFVISFFILIFVILSISLHCFASVDFNNRNGSSEIYKSYMVIPIYYTRFPCILQNKRHSPIKWNRLSNKILFCFGLVRFV